MRGGWGGDIVFDGAVFSSGTRTLGLQGGVFGGGGGDFLDIIGLNRGGGLGLGIVVRGGRVLCGETLIVNVWGQNDGGG